MCVFSSLLYIDLYPCVSQCQGETAGERDETRGRATELQAGSPGRSPQCHPRRSRAVASRDVTRRCSDATSHQGQPTVMVAWQPLFALLPRRAAARLSYFSHPHPYPTSYRSRTLYLAYTCRCSMNSPRRFSFSLSPSLSFSLFSLPPPFPPLFHSP